MMYRTQVTLDPELQRRVRERARDLGISFAEYIRSLVVRDLGTPEKSATPSMIFDLGNSGGADVAKHKNAMIAEALAGRAPKRRRTA